MFVHYHIVQLLAVAFMMIDVGVAQPYHFTVPKGPSVVLSLINAEIGTDGYVGGDFEIPKKKRIGSNPLRRSPGMGDALPLTPGLGSKTSSSKKAKSNPEIIFSTEGINHRDSRLAFGGNQYSVEPPDQGLCVGNGFILETVNIALRIYNSTTGKAISNVMTLNELYGFPPPIDRTKDPFIFGPLTFDCSCHYDPDTDRWFHLALDLQQDQNTGFYTGKNYLDLAVSKSGDPTGGWYIYRIPGVNDGTEGTPDHGCDKGPCFADFPHMSMDKNGLFITTNEFSLFGDDFIGAQVYAIPKSELVSGSDVINVNLFNTADFEVHSGEPGFTLWPALSSGKQHSAEQGGTNYFVSSNAVFDVNSGNSNEIIIWALSNTKSLNSKNTELQLQKTIVTSLQYAIPPPSRQKFGTIPLGNYFFNKYEPGMIDTLDSRIMDVRLANGKLWAVASTAVEIEGVQRTGIFWMILNVSTTKTSVTANIRKQGILALSGESLAMPTLGVTSAGRGVIGFTRVGENQFPSIGYASIDGVAGVGGVHMVEVGKSPQDGFTEYEPRPRWGDYGAAAVDGSDVYLANEYIEVGPCTEDEFLSNDCSQKRTFFANWSTRITKLTP